MKKSKYSAIAVFVCSYLVLMGMVAELHAIEELPMVLVVPSYNNKQFYKKNLDSIFDQHYQNFSVIYIDDASTDGTGDLVEAYVRERGFSDRFTLVRNPENKGGLSNIYHAIHGCGDESIIVDLDGDDWLDNDGVLATINEAYHDGEVWMTFGSYREYPSGNGGYGAIFPAEVIENNSFRRFPASPWVPIRTYYAGLFKRIKKADLCWKDKFLPMVDDEARMYAMIEMAGERHRFIDKVLYQYNRDNPISEAKNGHLYREIRDYVMNQKPYQRLSSFSK